mmetsp:Transcript_109261/g.304590  ORF Transcript_109261/g.304590 Transcript_109261/m.304590 type:complete len:315 (+) Transcript_109261:401-1345(+)
MLSDENCVLPLGTPASVLRDDGPAVCLVKYDFGGASLDEDGLNCERHAWAQLQRVRVWCVVDEGPHVQLGADEVPAIFPHHSEAVLSSKRVAELADGVELGTGPDQGEGPAEAPLRHLDEPPGLAVHLTDANHGRAVPEGAAEVDRDVEVHDVATLQGPRVGDAMERYLVGRCAEAAGEAVEVDAHRIASPAEDELADLAVDLVCCHTLFGDLAREGKRLGSQATGAPHALDDLRRLALCELIVAKRARLALGVVGVRRPGDVEWHLYGARHLPLAGDVRRRLPTARLRWHEASHEGHGRCVACPGLTKHRSGF